MRVLLMNHFPLQGSGSGVYTVNIAHALVRKGHEVCIIMPENEVSLSSTWTAYACTPSISIPAAPTHSTSTFPASRRIRAAS